jgi:hypothetical protein
MSVLEKLTVVQLVKILRTLVESIVYFRVETIFNINFNIILTSRLRSS